jgi:hypothetical protein
VLLIDRIGFVEQRGSPHVDTPESKGMIDFGSIGGRKE